MEEALDQIEDAFEAEDLERALSLTAALESRFPHEVEVLRYRAAALGRVGETESACEAFGRALRVAPDDLETLQAAAEVLVHDLDDHDAAAEALGLIKRALEIARRRDESRVVELHLLAAKAFAALGEPRRALEEVDRALALAPGDPEVLTERGIALFELCLLDEARSTLERVLRTEEDTPWAHHYLGLIAEHLGDAKAAARSFSRARRLAPEDFPSPIEISERAFEDVVEQALERLPERVRAYLSNVAIIVENLPDLDELRACEPPLSPGILGLFRGTPVTEQSSGDPWSHFPSAILLFQKNLERFARSQEELVEEIGVTLLHEVGHFLGLSEEELYDRGLD